MDPITIALSAALAQGLYQVGQKLLEKGVVEPALEPATSRLKKWVTGPYARKEKDQALLNAVQAALKETGVPVDDEDSLAQWGRDTALWRLQEGDNAALRRQIARAVLTFTGPEEEPPPDLLIALGWPNGRRAELGRLLIALRAQLYELPDWQPPIDYVEMAARRGLLQKIVYRLNVLENVYVATEAGGALAVVVRQQQMGMGQAVRIEQKYRQELIDDLRMHDFRGIVQVKRAIRLPLADIYMELGLLKLGSEKEREAAQARLLQMRQEDRVEAEERRLEDRVRDALAHSQRLLILGEPGAGKTISLRFVTLMLAYGYGATRLGLDMPYIPLFVRLADFARALEVEPSLTLDNYLFRHIAQAYASHTDLPRFLRWGLENGGMMLLLDGLDEVGGDPDKEQSLRVQVVARIQQFGDRWCNERRPNRVIVTSRIEGYWQEPLAGFDHVQLSPLRPPDEIEAFLLRWFTAYEQAQDSWIAPQAAEERAEKRVSELLPSILAWPSVRRLATNPLLLTILALIHESVGKLPNRRIELYDICAQTLVESWRQAQTGMPDDLLAELGGKKVIRVMAPLAYWRHQEKPGGTASLEEWQTQLEMELENAGFDPEEAADLSRRFLRHARHQAGLLAERGLGQYGFFHLTFEEYLAAREIARQPVEKRRKMVQAHWADPRWHEILLLAAGQLGIMEAKDEDVSDFIEDIIKVEPEKVEEMGRPAVLAGRALADIGPRTVSRTTFRWVKDALRQTMQDVDPETGQPRVAPPYTPIRTRYEAGEVLDELGWLPDDLNAWLPCPGCTENDGDLLAMKYLVTNAQFARFIAAGGYENPAYWGGEESEAWRWAQNPPSYRGKGPVKQPEYWNDPRFGRERRGYPVVGVSWYEANAYCRWLTELLRRARAGDAGLAEGDKALVADLLRAGAAEIRLPGEAEWEKIAGGTQAADRYPWDDPVGPVTKEEAEIIRRANTSEANVDGTSPVGMYPLGQSRPYGLMDMAGNVWEWMGSYYDDGRDTFALRGGSWYGNLRYARVASRSGDSPDRSLVSDGFRAFSPVVLPSDR